MRFGPALLLAFAALLMASMAASHGLRTAYLEVVQTSDLDAVARFRSPLASSPARPRFPSGCSASAASGKAETDSGDVFTTLLRCDHGLVGQSLGVDGLGASVSDAVVWIELLDGRKLTQVVTGDRPSFRVPPVTSAFDVGRDYVRMGVLHIATGADHLLFLLLLVLTLKRVRAVLLAETAFTFSHSLSFTATALDWVHVRSAPAEACVALSLFLLALDAGLASKARRPELQGVLLALVFGVVHGLGFAGGLREVGLPTANVAAALVGFGLGVEIGQLGFVLCVLLVVRGIAHFAVFPRIVSTAAYACGGLSAFWLIDRVWSAVR